MTETEFAVSSLSTHRDFILFLEDTGIMHDRVTGTFFRLKNTTKANIYLDQLQARICLVTYLWH